MKLFAYFYLLQRLRKVKITLQLHHSFLPPFQTGPGAHPASCTMGTGSFPEVKYGRGVTLTTYPLLVPWSRKSRAIPLPTLWATTGPVTGSLFLPPFLIMYLIATGNSCTLFLDSRPLRMGPIGCPETSARNYHSMLRNNQEERISYLFRGGSLKTDRALPFYSTFLGNF